MSRKSAVVERPFTKTLQWRNEKFNKKTKTVEQEKGWYYYVPSEIEGEKGTNVMLEMPFTFIWLVDATSFTGYNEAEKLSIYSNEVLNTPDTKELFPKTKEETPSEYEDRIKGYQVLSAKMGKEVIAEGLYNDIKDNVVAKGGKFCKPVYALLITDEGNEIVRFLMSGSSIETWLPFSKNQTGLKKKGIMCNGSVEKVKGSNEYEAPTFKFIDVREELLEEADSSYEVVKEYLTFMIDKPVAIPASTEEGY